MDSPSEEITENICPFSKEGYSLRKEFGLEMVGWGCGGVEDDANSFQ